MKFGSNIWSPKKVVVIFYQFSGDSFELKAIEHVKNAKEYGTLRSFDTIAEITQSFGKNKAYWLHVDGSGVLNRLVDIQTDYKRDLVLNSDPEDFYFTTISSDTNRLVSFVRRSVIEEFLDGIKQLNIFLLGISSGFAPVGALIEENEAVNFDFHIKRKSDRFLDFERTNKTDVKQLYNGKFLDRDQFISISIAQFLFKKDERVETYFDQKNQLEFKEYSKFARIGLLSVVSIFLVLVINYFYLNYLNDSIANKEAEVSLNDSNLSLLDNLNQEAIRKKQLVSNSGMNTGKFLSFYLDEIGQSVPSKIHLSEMYLFPLTEKLKEKRKVSLDNTKIEISGWTNDNIVLDDWIEKMDRQEWVKSIELIHYQKEHVSEAEFKIIIFLAQ